MPGYSGTPLARKLGIRPSPRIAVIDAPPGFVLGDLPADVVCVTRPRGSSPLDVILFFAPNHERLASRFGELVGRLSPSSGLWVAWPKRASGVATDLTGDRCAPWDWRRASWTTRCARSLTPGPASASSSGSPTGRQRAGARDHAGVAAASKKIFGN